MVGDIDSALKWAREQLSIRTRGNNISEQLVSEHSWSVVYRFDTNGKVAYLKIVPKPMALEPAFLQLLHDIGVTATPELIAANASLGCFLTTACGDKTLRHDFQGQLDIGLVEQAISLYTSIQRLTEKHLANFSLLGIPDWRLNQFPLLYKELITKHDLLLNDGLTDEELMVLDALVPTVQDLCENLASLPIPPTLGHCDFHEGNVVFDSRSHVLSIIDWGETVITHPFFSLNGCLWNITYFYQVSEDSETYRKLRQHCLISWLDVLSEDNLQSAFHWAHQLSGVHAALSYLRIYEATKNQQLSVSEEKRGAISGCLRTFINLNCQT